MEAIAQAISAAKRLLMRFTASFVTHARPETRTVAAAQCVFRSVTFPQTAHRYFTCAREPKALSNTAPRNPDASTAGSSAALCHPTAQTAATIAAPISSA